LISRRPAAIAALSLVLVAGSRAGAGPLFDPWLEQFQVGGAQVAPTDDGYPPGLLEPARPDSAWTRAALRCLDPAQPAPTGADLLRRWQHARDAVGGDATLRGLHRAAAAFADTATIPPGDVGGDAILGGELGARRFFGHLAKGDRSAARAEAEALAVRRGAGIEPRENFVWALRARRLARLGAGEPAETATIWPEALPLPSFDAGNAWALWVAYSRERGHTPVAPPQASDAWRAWFATAGRGGGVRPLDLTASGLAEPWRAALGAALLPKSELADHFRRHPQPPADADLQAMWVSGRRVAQQGDAAAYAAVAALPGLKPSSRLDLWRRAAELRLLNGQPERARADLDRALALARDGHGTNAVRRRLRQWVEQAMVLAIRKGDLTEARNLRDAGLATFTGAELDAFRTETRHWQGRLGAAAAAPDTTEVTARAAWVVESGRAAAATPAGPTDRAALVAAARPLWALWARWGTSFADTAATAARTREYARRLGDVRAAPDPAATVLAAVAPLLPEPRLAGQLLDADVARLTGGGTAARPSLVPALVTAAGDDHLQIHALLGFALVAGDMRGQLAAATMLPQRGLTVAERRLFLYPLPGEGPVRDALLRADSEPALVLAVARNESLFEPGVRSWAGALGFMQVMPFHYEQRGALPGARHWSNPPVSIAKGDQLLTEGARRYGGDAYRALAGYNAGYEATDRWDRQLGGKASRDIYLAWIGYPETRHYVEKVLVDREIYRDVIAARAAARD
jgi:soluble lytic murein transglycosylase